MIHPVNKFQTKLLAIWAIQIWHIVRLPVAPGAHEKMTVFHVLAKTAGGGGGGAALSTDADGEVTTFRFLLLRVTTPVCVDPAAAATAAAAEGKVNVA